MDLKYLVTDMDGVVFDRMPLYKSVFGDCLEQYISREEAGNFYYNTLGMPLRLQMKGVLSLAGIDAPEGMIEKLIAKYWGIIGDNDTKLFPGVKEVWDQLKAEGIRFCASSGSNTGELGQLIEKFKLPYDVYLGSDKFHKGTSISKYLPAATLSKPLIFAGRPRFWATARSIWRSPAATTSSVSA